MIASSIFDSFNARGLVPAQVAQTFVPPEQFSQLVMPRHSLVIGPRGSGKTTLLKMLQIPALRAWTHPDANLFRSAVSFVGVFVPADISWQAQIMALGSGRLSVEARTKLGFAAFVTHSLKALVEAIQQASDPTLAEIPGLHHLFVSLSRECETQLAAQIADVWQLRIPVNSLLALQVSLTQRLAEIARIANQHVGNPDEVTLDFLRQTPFLNLGLLESVSAAVEMVGLVSGHQELKWGLLFDELEIAPPHIRTTLIRAVRSTDQRLLLKLSISPYGGEIDILKDPTGPMAGDDYDPIHLMQLNRDVQHRFTRSLCNAILRDHGVTDKDVEEVFQQNPLSPPDRFSREERSRYAVGQPLYNKFRTLAQIDASFRHYLERSKVNLEGIASLPEDHRAQAIRKVTPIVVTREAFLSSAKRDRVYGGLRSRKRLQYFGTSSLFAIVEGNPRWVIGLLGPLLRQYAQTRVRITASKQQQAIEVATARFRALLKTIPYTADPKTGSHRGLLTLLDQVGQTIQDGILRSDFQPEPALSFIVDANITNELHDALGKALNAGALIAESDGEQIIGSLRGKRCRLSYMLAAHHNLPLLLGRPVALSRLSTPTRFSAARQVDLFGARDEQ